MLTVACVLKSGGLYDARWVAKLHAQVDRHLTVSHRFVCLSDVAVPCERIALEHEWPGWWSKIELFKLNGSVLLFDLDTLLIENVDTLADAAHRHDLICLRDFYRSNGLGSGVMAWRGDQSHLYKAFAADPHKWMTMFKGGDQNFIEAHTDMPSVKRWQGLMPGAIVSYKAHKCEQRIPDGAKVVCLHGKPKFSDMPELNAVRKAWELAA